MNTEEMVAVMQAFVAGKKIQQKFLHEDEWMDIDEPEWSWCDFEYRVKPECILPKTWEEFCEIENVIKKDECYINSWSAVCEETKTSRDSEIDKNLMPNKELADAFLALMQLIQLRDCYNQGWEPDWNDDKQKYIIECYEGKINTTVTCRVQRVLSFETELIRDKFLENFHVLIEEAKDLI